jgi:CMP-N-acetylneuraminic acid synthetase
MADNSGKKLRRHVEMYKDHKILAIISARGGSKGLPGKNIRPLAGKPLIAWTIEAARESKHIDRVVVSTDDSEIAEVAREWGAEVPFIRPAELAADDTPGIQPVIHAIKHLEEKEGYRPNITVLLQPTSPLRPAKDIDTVLGRIVDENIYIMISVVEVKKHPYWTMQLENGRLRPFIEAGLEFTSRQELPALYLPNGAIYTARTMHLLEKESFITEDTYAHIMDWESSIDIDDEYDFIVAECLLRRARGAG